MRGTIRQDDAAADRRKDMNDNPKAIGREVSKESSLKTVLLREIAHSRSGEKGRDSNVSVIAYDMADYPLLEREVTVEAVRAVFGSITKGQITRYTVPNVGALNFVLADVLEGGRTRTLAFDESGKALSSLMLTLKVSVDDNYKGRGEKGGRTEARKSA